MILADKIIDLRKKNGWSQEELAEKLDVSRQAVSKWESAQSVPDMNRILLLSDVFGVSTDYLLKDDLGPESGNVYDPPEDAGAPLRQVSMKEAQDFLSYRDSISKKISLGVLMCILSPIVLILLEGLRESGRIDVTETAAAGIGLLFLFLLVGGAVALFVVSGITGKRYEYLSQEIFETEYGVDGMVRERREREHGSFVSQLVTGIVMCVVSAIPIFAAMILPPTDAKTEELRYCVAVSTLLVIVAFGVWMIVRAGIRRGSCSILLQEGDYSKEKKTEQKSTQTLSAIYWGVVTAGYLAYSFITNNWQRSWIVWPVAGVLYGAVIAIYSSVHKSADK